MKSAHRNTAVTLDQILRAREERVARQTAALAQFGSPLVSITIVIPGPIKDGWIPRRAMEIALKEMECVIKAKNWSLLSRQALWRHTGPEAIYVVDANAEALKLAAIELEEGHPIGRLWDVDVITKVGVPLSRAQLGVRVRRCLVCEQPAHECGRSRRHSVPELLKEIRKMVDNLHLHALSTSNYFPVSQRPALTAHLMAEYASEALLTELMLTPKPGLVDQRNSGAHRDMNMSTFLKSARVLSTWFPRFVEIGYRAAQIPACDFLPLVRPAGLLCEEEMFEATRGINTHKGAIFSLGLLCAAAGRLLANGIRVTRERICTEMASICGGLVSSELAGKRTADTAGERIFRLHGLTGARGEAASGYWTVRSIALPVYDRLRLACFSEEEALLQVLLHLLAVNGDTNLVSRGGLAGLEYVREYSRNLLVAGGVVSRVGLKKMVAFDDELIARNLSPGGCADLLAVTIFLARFPAEDSAERLCSGRPETRLRDGR